MNDIPGFDEALQRFRRFLIDRGHSDHVFWVFREDLWRLSISRVLVRYPPPSKNDSLAEEVFVEGRARGLVEIVAVAAAREKVAATVWFPKYPQEEVQGWNQGMRLSILEPLPKARLVPVLPWRFP